MFISIYSYFHVVELLLLEFVDLLVEYLVLGVDALSGALLVGLGRRYVAAVVGLTLYELIETPLVLLLLVAQLERRLDRLARRLQVLAVLAHRLDDLLLDPLYLFIYICCSNEVRQTSFRAAFLLGV